MMTDERFDRFEELDAGRALGELDAAETAEWQSLAAGLGVSGDAQLDLLAAELEAAAFARNSVAMPAGLAAALKANIPQAAPQATITPIRPADAPPSQPTAGKIVIGPWLGWAVAACLMALLVVTRFLPDKPAAVNDADRIVETQAPPLTEAPDLVRLPFAGLGEVYADASGEVVWSDSRQDGYMTLANLPANDPTQAQYQLWIVDPTRDELPVDGGVFDIPAGPGPVTIPIDAKLAVHNPALFLITLEKPGGVVRSKREIDVALAAQS